MLDPGALYVFGWVGKGSACLYRLQPVHIPWCLVWTLSTPLQFVVTSRDSTVGGRSEEEEIFLVHQKLILLPFTNNQVRVCSILSAHRSIGHSVRLLVATVVASYISKMTVSTQPGSHWLRGSPISKALCLSAHYTLRPEPDIPPPSGSPLFEVRAKRILWGALSSTTII